MQRIVFCTFLLLVGSGGLGATLFSGQIAGAAGKRVARKAAQPPLPVVFTSNGVQVGNTVKLDPASNAVSGTVGLSGSGNTVKIDPANNTVDVASSQTNPVSVTNVNDGQNVYVSAVTCTIPKGVQGCLVHTSPVAAGTRLVVETVAARITVPIGTVIDDAGFGPGTVWFTPVKIGSDGTNDHYALTQQLRAYVTGADTPAVEVDFSGALSAAGSFDFTIEGYLVNTT